MSDPLIDHTWTSADGSRSRLVIGRWRFGDVVLAVAILLIISALA